MRIRAARITALAFAGVVVLLLAAAYLAAAALGWSGREYVVYGFVGIPILGGTSIACGAVLIWHRPANAVGWMLAAIGFIAALTTASIAILGLADRDDWAWGSQVFWAHLVMVSWSAWLTLIPLALLAFPVGGFRDLLSRVLAILIAGTGIVTLALLLADPQLGAGLIDFGIAESDPLVTGPPIALLAATPLASIAGAVGVPMAASGILTLAVIGVLTVGFARGGTQQRQRLFWILLPAVIGLAVVALQLFPTLLGPELGPPLVPVVFTLVPIGVTVAIVRSELFDVRRVFARAVGGILLAVLLGAFFLLLVAALDGLLAGSGGALVAALVVAVAFEPARRLLQRAVDRLVLGRRAEPAYLIGLVGTGISRAVGLTEVLRSIADALRLPRLAIRVGETTLAAVGAPSGSTELLPLRYDAAELGTLEVGLDPNAPSIRRDDRRVLELVAPVLAALVRLALVSDELSASRGRLVESAEQERRRVQRDLHDGVASALGGIAFKIEGIRSQVERDPSAAVGLLADVHGDVQRVSAALRDVIDDLTPPELETLGLVPAIRHAATGLRARVRDRELVILIDAPERITLPAAVEVAAYRIVLEAIGNAVRHGRPVRVAVSLGLDHGILRVKVEDEGEAGSAVGAWRPGVGLESMRQRTEILGGVFVAGPSPRGGTVDITIPVAADD
jgi:signal transduction histidine kinase